MREAECIDCGQRVNVEGRFGPLPARCVDCTAARVRQMQAESRARRKQGRAKRDVRCADCGRGLEWSGRGRPRDRCESCNGAHLLRTNRERALRWVKANPERARELAKAGYQRNADAIRERKRDEHYVRKYGLSREDRDAMLAAQGGLCAICGCEPNPNHRGGRLHIDHCHATGTIRGLLCSNCNTLLGLADDDPARLMAAAKYLKKHKT